MKLIIFILLFIILILLVLLFSLKKQIKLITRQLKEFSTEKSEKNITITLMDRDLNFLVSEINNSINRQRRLKVQMYRQKKQIQDSIAYISHDLRTPLTSIVGYLQLIKKSSLDDKQAYNLNIALNKCETLKKLQSEFFELSTLELNNTVPELGKINITNVISDIALENIHLFEKANIIPEFKLADEPVYILGDDIIVRRIIQNLITNAINYSNSHVSIGLDTEHEVTFKIKNNLKYNHNLKLDTIFDRFYTGDKSRNSTGTGLGLAIVKLLVEKIHGSISAQIIDDTIEISIIFSNSINLPLTVHN